jgi:hypothetical protein
LERRCDEHRAELVGAIDELHQHWLPVERAVQRVKHFATPGVLLGGLSLRWLGAVPKIATGLFGAVRLLAKTRYLLPAFRKRRRARRAWQG